MQNQDLWSKEVWLKPTEVFFPLPKTIQRNAFNFICDIQRLLKTSSRKTMIKACNQADNSNGLITIDIGVK